MTPGVAVVLPAHDAAATLPAALRSLQQQTLAPAEVVVVDDGSKDDTAAVAGRHGARVLRQPQRGPGAARNAGIRATAAPLVAFLDADDWFAADKLERQLAELERLGASAICSDAWLAVDGRPETRKNRGRRVPARIDFERLLAGNPIVCSSVVARRAALEQAGLFDEDPELIATEDYDLWLRLAQREPIVYLDEPLVHYRVHAGSLTSNERFLRGVDRIVAKIEGTRSADARLRRLLRRRRAGVRLDLAWDLLQAPGRAGEARALIRAAQHCAFTWPGVRMWLRSLRG